MTVDLAQTIRDVPDFPQAGILFKDLTTLWKDPAAFKQSIEELTALFKGQTVDVVAAVESRGFVVGAPLAYNLGAGFVPIRKLGKLPGVTVKQEYALEYGANTIEMHADAIQAGQKVLIVDDLLATGGTVAASMDLIKQVGGDIIGIAFLVELCFLHGRDRLGDVPIVTLVKY